MKRNLAVGHFYNEPFVEGCAPWTDRIKEVFFAWPGVLSCRPAPVIDGGMRERLHGDLRWCREHGILLDTLFNCNCYGDLAVSPDLADFVTAVLKDMDRQGLFPDIVTTTSPFIAAVLRRRFPGLHLRGSVNLRVHGTLGFEYVDDLFDSFYVSREHHRDLGYLRRCAQWAAKHGKTLGMQLNSGCLRQCPYQQFHDNLHGHDRIRQSAAGKQFDFNVFLCRRTYLRGGYENFLKATWIRPEDAPLFEEHVSVMKLSTRRIARPTRILDAYASGHYDGNLLDLMDPVHSEAFSPYIIDNASFPDDWATSGIGAECANNCTGCGKCTEVLKRVLRRP